MPLLPVDQFGPAFHVTIKGRQGSNVQDTDINNDIIAITTSRQINSPAGVWAITLISRRDSGGRTWAQRIRPMDYVEIRFQRYDVKSRNTGSQNQIQGSGSSQLKIIMRGFVDKVTETVSIDDNGRPFRQTTITGKDMGKLLLIKQIYVLPELGGAGALAGVIQQGNNPEQILLGDMWTKLTETDSPDQTISPQEFLDRIKKYIFDKPDTQNSSPGTQGAVNAAGTNLVEGVPDMKFTTKDMDDLFVSPLMIQTFEGPVWNLISHLQGSPVCEILVHDTDEGPELLWRWAPFKDKDGKVIDPVKDAGTSTDLSLKEIMQYSVSTSDENVLSYFFVYPQQAQQLNLPIRFEAMSQGSAQGSTGGGPTGAEGENPVYRSELAKRYGFKQLEVNFPLIKMFVAPKEKEHQEMTTDWTKQGTKIAKWLDKAYNNNANLEEGTIVIRGNEKIDIGTYVKFKETREEFYVEGIRHDFILNPPRFTTALTVTRGLWSSPSPYPDDTGQAGAEGGTSSSSSSGGNFVDPGTGKGETVTDTGSIPSNVG